MELDIVKNMNRRGGKFFYVVFNKKEDWLGRIMWFPKWKKWIWEQQRETIMSKECLQLVVDFMENLGKKH